MTFLTGQGMLNDALSIIQDNGTTIRAKMLGYMNMVAQKLATVRTWQFLNTSVSVTPVNNVITKPADFGEISYISGGSAFFFDTRNRLSAGEAVQADRTSAGFNTPVGFTEDNTTITLHGATATGDLVLGYVIEPPAIADSSAVTVWPAKCRSVFARAILDWYYEYDMDERKAVNVPIAASELSELKKWDNSQKPKTQNSRRGYMRSR